MSKYSSGDRVSVGIESSRCARAVVEDALLSRRASGSSERWRLGLCALVLSSVAFAIMPVSSFGQNLIINGGFTINDGDGHVALDSAPPWLSTGGNPYGYLICTTSNCGGLFSISPYNGVAYAAITLASGGGMSQTVTLAKSGNYQFSFDYATGPYLITPPPLEPVGITASVGGQTVFNKANLTAPTWTQFSTTVSLMAGANTVTFIGTPPLNNLADGFIDDVSLTCSNCSLSLGGGLPTNQTNVGNAINNFINGGGTLPTNFQNLFNYSPPQLQAALTQLDGEAATDAEKGAFALMNQFLGLMLDPFVTGRIGTGGGPIPFAPEQAASFPPDIALAYASVLKAPPSLFAQRWTAWGSTFGASSTTNGNAAIGSNNVTASDYGFAAGMDYHLTPDTLYGFALAGAGTNWGLAQGLGSGRSDAFQAGVYGKSYWGPAYVAGALAFSNNWFTTNRTALGDQITAGFNGQSYGGRVETGYRYSVPVSGTVIGATPYAAMQTQWFHTPTYSETDLAGGGLGLTYDAMTANDTRSELGARFDDLLTLNSMPLTWRSRFAWAHDWVSNPTLGAVFESLPGSTFFVNGAKQPADSLLASSGADLQLARNWSLGAKFDGEFAKGSQTYGGSGTLRYTW
jgi:Autotransporter beta-domain